MARRYEAGDLIMSQLPNYSGMLLLITEARDSILFWKVVDAEEHWLERLGAEGFTVTGRWCMEELTMIEKGHVKM